MHKMNVNGLVFKKKILASVVKLTVVRDFAKEAIL